MDSNLEAFKAEASKAKEDGRDDDLCVELAQTYVDVNKAACDARFGHLSVEQLVADVSHYRASGRDDDLWATEAWLRAQFQPQRIGGSGAITIKRAGR